MTRPGLAGGRRCPCRGAKPNGPCFPGWAVLVSAGGGVRSGQGGGCGAGVGQHSSPRGTGAAWRSAEEGGRGFLEAGGSVTLVRSPEEPRRQARTARPRWEEPGCDISSELGPGSTGPGWTRGAVAGCCGSREPGERQRGDEGPGVAGEAGLGSAQRELVAGIALVPLLLRRRQKP